MLAEEGLFLPEEPSFLADNEPVHPGQERLLIGEAQFHGQEGATHPSHCPALQFQTTSSASHDKLPAEAAGC